MCQNLLEWRLPLSGHPMQKRRLEPAPVLVCPLYIQVSLFPIIQSERVRRAALKPDIEDIEALLKQIVIVIIPEEARLCAGLIPCICAFHFKSGQNTSVHRFIHEKEIRIIRGEVFTCEQGKGNTPRPLTRQQPIRTRLHHRGETVLGGRRSPDNIVHSP